MNHSAASGPGAMIDGRHVGWLELMHRLACPSRERRAICPAWTRENHSAPSAPVVIAYGPAPGVCDAIFLNRGRHQVLSRIAGRHPRGLAGWTAR